MKGAIREPAEDEPVELNDLRRRLETSPVIEQAKGMLMGFYGCDADAAFALLRRWSSHRNRKLHLVCADLLAAAATPTSRPFGGLQDGIESFGRRTRRSDPRRSSGAAV